MKIEYDKEVDALYIRLQEKKIARTREFDEGLTIDFDVEGNSLGSKYLMRLSAIPKLRFSISQPKT